MNYHLVVLRPFGGFKRGDVITDRAVIAKIVAGPEASSVVRISRREG